MNDHRRALEVCPLPAFLTGTSTEYIGDRPLPRVVRERPVVFLIGPAGVGKSLVASRLTGGAAEVRDTAALQLEILGRVRQARWDPTLLHCPELILDGPVWLHNRPAVVELLQELLELRSAAGRHTILCQSDADGSAHLLLDRIPVGRCATVALRFPTSRSARLRAAERICADHGIPLRCAKRTANTPDWSYRNVLARIRGPFFSLT